MLIISLLSVAMLTVFYVSSAKQEADRLEIVKMFARDQKMELIENIVNNLVTVINIQRRLAEEDARRELEQTLYLLKAEDPEKHTEDNHVMTLVEASRAIHPSISVWAYNRESGHIFGESGDPESGAAGFTGAWYEFEDIFADHVLSEIFELGDTHLIGCGVEREVVYNAVLASMQEYVDSRILMGDEAVRVDLINSYSGEGDFARWVIIPFYQRRGDAVINEANAGYYATFEQLVRNGESFTEITSGGQLERLVYAKLYRPYDWVVSTGVSAEDIQNFTNMQMDRFNTQRQDILRIMAQMFLLFTGMALAAFIWIGLSFFRRTDNEFKTMDSLNKIDTLTECFNRSGISRFMEESFAHFLRNEKPSSIIFGDIDYFKQVNDNHGHEYGDFILQFVARTIKCVLPANDRVCRWGGEEFVVLLRGKNLETGKKYAEMIRSSVEMDSEASTDKRLRVTISLGLSTFKKGDADWTAAVKRADEAMYLSKKEGRNRVTVDGE